MPGSKWKLVRTNATAKCRGCGGTVGPQEFRLQYQPSQERHFGRGYFFEHHHISASCLAKSQRPLFTKKEDFGWYVQPLPARMTETPAQQDSKVQAARVEAGNAAKAAMEIQSASRNISSTSGN